MVSRIKNVGFIGLGKLGLECAEVMAQQYSVTGYDIYPRTSDLVAISETLQGAVEGQDIIFIAVQTPHDEKYDGSGPIRDLPNKDFDYSIVNEVLEQVNKFANKDQLVVLISTVLPGTTRRKFINRISNARFVYNPYLIAMGSTSWDMVNPEMVIIGTEDGTTDTCAQQLIEFYRPLMDNNPRYVVGTWDEAEAIKIFYNTFISTKIGLVNMIQDVAERNGNMNVDVVTDALADSTMRIVSKKYMKAGMGDAGPCHPRDNIALRYLAEKLNLGYDIFDTIMQAREEQARNLARKLKELQAKHNLPIVIHGKSYKPGIELIDGSYSLLIGNYLIDMGADFKYCDPLTGDKVKNGQQCIVLLAHEQQVTYGYTGELDKQPLYFMPGTDSIIVDPWRTFPQGYAGFKVIQYGNTRS